MEPSNLIARLPKQFFSDLTNKASNLVSQGHDVINLGQGNPDQPTPIHIVKTLKEASQNFLYHRYPPFNSFFFLKEAVSVFYKKTFNVDIDPSREVAVVPGSKTGLNVICQALLNPRDLALVPNPCWPDFLSSVAIADGVYHNLPLLEENDYLPDYSKIPPSISKTAKLLYTNYPNNPTGGIANEDFFEHTVSFATRNNISVIHDLAYPGFVYDGNKSISFLSAKGAKNIGVEVISLSKIFNMAGWRVAFVVGNPNIIKYVDSLQEHLFHSFFGGIQEAAKEALLNSEDHITNLVATYGSRRKTLVNALNKAGWDVKLPKGSMYVWAKIPEKYNSQSFSNKLLEKSHIVVAPGIGFGSYGNKFIRFSLVEPENRLIEAANRIKNFEFNL